MLLWTKVGSVFLQLETPTFLWMKQNKPAPLNSDFTFHWNSVENQYEFQKHLNYTTFEFEWAATNDYINFQYICFVLGFFQSVVYSITC